MDRREGEWEEERKGKGRQRKRGKEVMEIKQKPCSDVFRKVLFRQVTAVSLSLRSFWRNHRSIFEKVSPA